ncbi:MAG: PAS domain S-box protein [Syntrophales bacterium]|nr:PAS domain S-box protein [Syntrophales bacterium]
MKKKIIVGLSVFSLFFFLGGIYIIITIEKATFTFDNFIKLHQVGILREQLLIQSERTQTNLNLKGTPYASSMDVIVGNVTNLTEAINTCFRCHHSEDIIKEIRGIREHIEEYKLAISRVFTIRANTSRLEKEKDNANKIGVELIFKIDRIIGNANSRLEKRTKSFLEELTNTKIMLFMIVAAGPFLALGLTFAFIKNFTKPINVLLDAIRKLKKGNLDYKIEGLKDEFGEVAESFNEMADSLKKHMGKIEESEIRYRTLFENAAYGIFIIDLEGNDIGRIVAANNSAAIMSGYTNEELLSMKITDIDMPDSSEKEPEHMSRILRGEKFTFEVEHRRKDGSIYPLEVNVGLLRVGGHKHALTFYRDISERKHAEEKLLRTEQMKVCGEIATGLAHEIKNPLAGIKASIEVLRDELNMTADDKRVVKCVIDEINRIEYLLNELLSFARPLQTHLMPLDLNQVIEGVLAVVVVNDPKEDGRIVLVVDLQKDMPQIMADPMQLKQVLLNLYLNGVDAMPDGGVFTVKTFHDKADDTVKIRVSDTGKGIQDSMIDKIFRPFCTTKSKGTGMGLAITKQIIESHGGKITLAKNGAGGAAFIISLPCETTADELV